MNHIAYLIPTIDRIGGAERQVLQLAAEIAKRQWKVTVIALSGSGENAARVLQSKGIEFHTLAMRKGLLDVRGWIRLHRWIAHNRPDVVHAHLAHASLMARWSRIYSPVRVLIDTIHSPAIGDSLRQIGFRLSAGSLDCVTAVSRAASAPWLAANLIDDRQLITLPNALDTDHWKRDDKMRVAVRGQLGLQSEFLWVLVGRLDPVKNHATLLRAFAALPHTSRLVIAGEGPLHQELRTLATQLCLLDRVLLPGFQEDVRPWLMAADAFVLPSSWEGLPLSLLEAAACELPAVISDIPGSREALPGLLCDATFPIGDAHSLAVAMRRVMSLPESGRRQIGRTLRESVCERYSLPTVLPQWENLYHSLLGNNPQPARFGARASASRRILRLQ